jgi:EAL domain-containing protein (putative c-di-GMP-specific phosphodiesterase class I)
VTTPSFTSRRSACAAGAWTWTRTRKALEGGDLEIVYQPIVRMSDSSVAGFEALTRWEHPLYGRIPPSEFVASAEESGQIIQLGLYVLERAARELASWQSAMDGEELPLFRSMFPAGSCCGRTLSTTSKPFWRAPAWSPGR